MSVQAGTYATPRADLGEALQEYPLNYQGFVADQVLPVFGTQKKAASFSTLTRESILRTVDVRRSKGGAYNRASIGADDLSYRCEERGLEGDLADEDRAFYASDFDAQMAVTAMTRDRLAREREKAVSALIFNATTWTGTSLYTDLGTDWDNAASTIKVDVDGAKNYVLANSGVEANTIVIPRAAITSIQGNTDMKARLQYVQALTDSALPNALGAIFGLSKVIVAGGVYNSGAEGETFATANIWSPLYAWIGVTATTQNLAEPCVGRTMLWTGDSPELYTVEEYYEVQTRKWVYRVRQNVDENIFDANFGHLLKIDT